MGLLHTAEEEGRLLQTDKQGGKIYAVLPNTEARLANLYRRNSCRGVSLSCNHPGEKVTVGIFCSHYNLHTDQKTVLPIL